MDSKTRFSALFFFICLVSVNIFGQDEPNESSPWSAGADIVSRYIWRGVNLGGSSPSIQPSLEYGFGSDNHSFSVGVWGAYSVAGPGTGQEADLYLSYTIKDVFSVIVTDYFFPDEASARNSYFNYNMDWDKIDAGTEDQTGHIVEAMLSFNGTENFPVSIMFAINLWGADSRKYENQAGTMIPTDGIVKSKYIEVGYSTAKAGVGIDLFAGVTLDNPNISDGEPEGFYGQQNAGLINLGLTLSKEIKISETFTVPVSGSVITNPEAGNIFMVFGVSF